MKCSVGIPGPLQGVPFELALKRGPRPAKQELARDSPRFQDDAAERLDVYSIEILEAERLVEDADDVPPGRHLDPPFWAPRVELVNQGEAPFCDHLSELGGRHVASLADIRGALCPTGLGMVNDRTTSRSQDSTYLGNVGVHVRWGDVHENIKRPDPVDALAGDGPHALSIGDIEFDVPGLSKSPAAQLDAAVGEIDKDQAPRDGLKRFSPSAGPRPDLHDLGCLLEVRQHHLFDLLTLPIVGRRPLHSRAHPIPPLTVLIIDGSAGAGVQAVALV